MEGCRHKEHLVGSISSSEAPALRRDRNQGYHRNRAKEYDKTRNTLSFQRFVVCISLLKEICGVTKWCNCTAKPRNRQKQTSLRLLAPFSTAPIEEAKTLRHYLLVMQTSCLH